MSRRSFGRRALLRGIGGTVVGLPLLDAMLDESGTAHADGSALPCRFILAFGGFSVGQDNKPVRAAYEPTQTGPGFDITAALSPLMLHGDVSSEFSVVSGLTVPTQLAKDVNEPIPPAGRTVGFHFHTNPIISGNRSQTNGFFDASVTGPSADYVMAQQIGAATTHKNLAYRAQAQFYSAASGVDIPDNRDTITFDESGTPVPPTFSPQLAYNALFSGFTPDDPADAAARALALQKRKSVLDLVDRRMDGRLKRLGASDKIRIERHFDEIRALEARLQAMPPDQTGACMLPADPGQDPPLGGEQTGPSDYDVNKGYSGEELRAPLLADFIHMAVTCDLTRVVSFMLSMWQSYMNIQPLTGWASNMHITNHGQNPDAPITELENVIAWHVDKLAYLVSKLRNTPEGAGSVLDNCALVFLNEGGHGYGYEGGLQYSSHSTDNMVALVAGRAGGLQPGQHIVAPASANHPVNVTLSAMQAAGYAGNSLGEVSGTIPALFG